jgi:hypothetical protein
VTPRTPPWGMGGTGEQGWSQRAVAQLWPSYLPSSVSNMKLSPKSCPGHDTTAGCFHIRIDVYPSSAACPKRVDSKKKAAHSLDTDGVSHEGPWAQQMTRAGFSHCLV